MKKISLTLLFTLTLATAFGQRTAQFKTEEAARSFVQPGAELFGATARIGSAAHSGTSTLWELGLGPTRSNPTITRNFNWKNGKAERWSLRYSAAESRVTVRVAGEVLTYSIPRDRKIDSLILRAVSVNCSSIKIDNLCLGSSSVAFQRPVANGDRNFLGIRNIDATKDFILGGTLKMSWQGNIKGDRLGMDVRGFEAVPEPTSMAALGLGLLMAYRRKKAK